MQIIKLNGKIGYSRLSHLPFNRDFKVRQNLVDSMNRYGFVGTITLVKTPLITGKEELFIADGQHRAVCADFLDIPFAGSLVDHVFKSIAEIVHFTADLNTTQHPWNIRDYIKAYVSLNYKEYIKLNKIAHSCPYTVNSVATMLTGFRSKGSVKEKIENGFFRCNLIKDTENTLRIAANLSKIGKLTNRMILALHYVASLSSFDEEVFEEKYFSNYEKIKELKLDDYTDIFSSWL